jgi:hypothetical protein
MLEEFGLPLNVFNRFCIEPDLSRGLRVSGEDSRDKFGDGLLRFKELALSAIDGDLESRTLPGLTAKNAGDAIGAVAGAPVVLGEALENFSSAFIR